MSKLPTNPKAAETTAVSAKPQTVKDWLNSEQFKGEVARALPSVCKPDRFLRVALTALTKTPKLAECTPNTVLRCFLDCAALGIEPDNRRAYLIPFKDSCTLVIGYQGLVELARRSGEVVSITAEAIRKGDVFSYGVKDGRPVLDWTPNVLAERGEVIAFFATAVLKGGGYQFAVMTRAEIDGIRDRSNAVKAAKKFGKETPWDTDYVEMGKKTVTRRLCKMLPLSPEAHDAIDRDDDDFVDIESASVPTRVSRTSVRSRASLNFGEAQSEPAEIAEHSGEEQ